MKSKSDLRYQAASDSGNECVEFEVEDETYGITRCVVDVATLLNGRTVFPCGSGADYTLSAKQIASIRHFVCSERKKIGAECLN